MLGDHVLLEQMMMDSLLSDMGSCLQVFQHHPDLKDRCFELFLLTSEKKDCIGKGCVASWELTRDFFTGRHDLAFGERQEKGLLTALGAHRKHSETRQSSSRCQMS